MAQMWPQPRQIWPVSAQFLSTSAPNSVDSGQNLADAGRHRPQVSRSRTKCWPKPPEVSPTSAQIRTISPAFARIEWSMWVPNPSKSDSVWSTQVDAGRMHPPFAQLWATIDQFGDAFGPIDRLRPPSAAFKIGDAFGPQSVARFDLRPNFGRTRANFGADSSKGLSAGLGFRV